MSSSSSVRRIERYANRICEGRLRESDRDHLQELILEDPALAEVLVKHLEIHSFMHWDLGVPKSGLSGIHQDDELALSDVSSMEALLDNLIEEAILSEPPITVTTHPNRQTSRNSRIPTLIAAGLIIALGGLFWWEQNREVQIADNVDPIPNITTPEAPVDKIVSTEDQNSKSALSTDDDLPPELPVFVWSHASTASNKAPDNKELPEGSKNPLPPAPPVLTNDAEIVAAINKSIQQGWTDWEVKPSPQAEADEWARRVFLDLAGRIPSEQELNTFLENSSDSRDATLVRQLVASPEFAMNWSTRWMHRLVGRAPRSRVDQVALQKFLRDSILQNAGWDQTVQKLVSAQGDPQDNGAANFLVAHLNNQAVPATAHVTRSLMGFQIQCAQCHHHPFYSMTQQQFWEFNSFFQQSFVARVPTEDKENSEVKFELRDRLTTGPTYYESRTGTMHVAYPKFDGLAIESDTVKSHREQLAEMITSGEEPLVAQAFVNRVWAELFGFGFTQPVDDIGPHNPPSHPELFALLSRAFVASNYDVKRLYTWICTSDVYRLSSRTIPENASDFPAEGAPAAFSRMYPKALSPEQVYDSLHVLAGESSAPARKWEGYVKERRNWVSQFVTSIENDENDEFNHFEGSVSQALALMNSELVVETTSPETNDLLKDLIEASIPDQEKFERICKTVLSREPRPEEKSLFRRIAATLRQAQTPQERQEILASGLSDLYWAYLNSSEFIVNH